MSFLVLSSSDSDLYWMVRRRCSMDFRMMCEFKARMQGHMVMPSF